MILLNAEEAEDAALPVAEVAVELPEEEPEDDAEEVLLLAQEAVEG